MGRRYIMRLHACNLITLFFLLAKSKRFRNLNWTNLVLERSSLGTSLLDLSRARCIINTYCDVKLSLCSFSRNEQVMRFSWEEKGFVISMKKLVISLMALSLFFLLPLLLSDVTQTAQREGKIFFSSFQNIFRLFFTLKTPRI